MEVSKLELLKLFLLETNKKNPKRLILVSNFKVFEVTEIYSDLEGVKNKMSKINEISVESIVSVNAREIGDSIDYIFKIRIKSTRTLWNLLRQHRLKLTYV